MARALRQTSKNTVAGIGFFSVLTPTLLVLLFGSYAFAQPPQTATQPLMSQDDTVVAGSPLAKVSSDLRRMRAVSMGLAAGQSLKSIVPETTDWIVYKDGNPVLEFILNTTDEKRIDDVVVQLKTSGCTITEVYPKYGRIYGTCDLSLLDQIAADDAISAIYPSYKPIHRKNGRSPQSTLDPQDSPVLKGMDNRADLLMESDKVRAKYNVDGKGVKVGVISDSFDRAGTGKASGSGCDRFVTGTSSQTSGYLPEKVYVIKDDNDTGKENDDEGRAMSELIYDVAPGATLLFHAGMRNEAAMASAIDALRSCNATIIVDDIDFGSEPIFQDGIIAQAAQTAVKNGVPYFSSAGNTGSYGVSAPFSDNGTGWHKFGTGNTKARITIENNRTLQVVLQWNDPFSGTLGPGASRDLNLYLVDAGGKILASSTNTQGCDTSSPSGNPLELIQYKNTAGSSQDTYLKVEYKCGDKSNLKMRIVNHSTDDIGFDTAVFNGPTIAGHPMADGVVAVAAMNVSSKKLEPFTSLGGNLPIYFSPTGTPLSQTRTQPVITAPDAINTSVPGFDPFFGTSASAPNAAAVGALVLSYRSMTPAALTTLLTTTATAIESPGWHALSGYGLINALSAFQSIAAPGPATLVSPTGTITTTTPPYVWNAVANATQYLLYVNDSTGTKIQVWYTSAQAGCSSGTGTCSVTPDAALAAGSGTWWIQTWNSSGYGPWSSPMNFTVVPPGKAILNSPSGAISTNTPAYEWNADPYSTWYYLWVTDSTGIKIQQWYSAAGAGCPNGTGTCSVTPATSLAGGSAKWWIQTWSPVGYGPWSDAMSFTVPTPPPPGKVTLVSPLGITSPNNWPSFTWNTASNATSYLLYVNDSSGNRVNTWYPAATSCSGGTCSAAPGTALGAGTVTWWVQSWNPNGNGPWSDAGTFTAPAPILPGKATLVSPSGNISTTTPAFSWNADVQSSWYWLWVNDSTGTKISQWYTAAQAGCGSGTGTCSISPGIALATGSGKWWVETWNPNGPGPWSDPMAFTVGAASGFSE